MSEAKIGIDFGGSNLKIARFNDDQLDVIRMTPGYSLKTLPTILTDLRQFNPEAIGVSCPGDIDYQKGSITKSLRLGTDIPISEIVRQSLNKNDLPVYLLNDAQAAGLAELHLGAGKEKDDFLFINLGSNPGGAVILSGHLMTNANGKPLGRVGHLCIDPNGPLCRCGKKGCWSTYLSAKAIRRRASEIVEKDVSLPELTDLANSGHQKAQQVWQQVAHILAQGTVDLANFLGLEVIIIGGGISLAGQWLFDPLIKKGGELSRYPIEFYPSRIEARLASVTGATILAEKGYEL